MMNSIIILYLMVAAIAASVAYTIRRIAGQAFWHALLQALITFMMPVLLFQDIEHAFSWFRKYGKEEVKFNNEEHKWQEH